MCDSVLACSLFSFLSAIVGRFRLLLLAAALAFLLPQLAVAQTNYTWDPGAINSLGAADGSGTWDTTTANWFQGSSGQTWVNVASSSANNAIFGDFGIYTDTVSLGLPIDVGTMTFQPMGLGGNYVFGTSGTNSLTNYTGITMNSGSGPVTIGSSSGTGVVFGAANTWTNNSANLLTVSSNITDSTFGLTVAGTGNTLISGAFVGGGAGGLTMNGIGTLTLTNAANSFTGNIAVNSGTLALAGLGTLGGGTYAGTISLGSSLSGTLLYGSSATQTLSGAISGTGGVTLSGIGTGTLILSNTGDNYTGATTINNGTLSLTGSLNSSSALVLGSGTFSFGNATTSQILNGLTLNSGTSVITNTNSGATSTLTFGTITHSPPAASLDFSSAAKR